MADDKNLPTTLSEEGEGQLVVDVYQAPTEFVVEATIAGVKPDDLNIDATNESITIRGERKKDVRISDGDYLYQECFWGRFSRSIILPEEIDPDKAESNIKNGVLTIRLPKIGPKDKGKKITVKME